MAGKNTLVLHSKCMPTYKEIIIYVKNNYGYTPKTCWIADVKEQLRYNVIIAHNRMNKDLRKHKCPMNKIKDIKDAIKNIEK